MFRCGLTCCTCEPCGPGNCLSRCWWVLFDNVCTGPFGSAAGGGDASPSIGAAVRSGRASALPVRFGAGVVAAPSSDVRVRAGLRRDGVDGVTGSAVVATTGRRVVFFATALRVVAFFAVVLLAATLFSGAFFAVDFLGAAFLVATFFVVDFFVVGFFAVDFFAVAFFATDFFATFAVFFVVAALRAVDFFVAAFFAAAFFAVGRVGDMAGSCARGMRATAPWRR